MRQKCLMRVESRRNYKHWVTAAARTVENLSSLHDDDEVGGGDEGDNDDDDDVGDGDDGDDVDDDDDDEKDEGKEGCLWLRGWSGRSLTRML